ncbi:type II secretion system F family protein [Mameliella sediminis]|uniref:type II secretion system F family protein n=1 Tax=Mameliella sediminis TaxID=2836866 RepID=UPI001C46671F|nr:type II secretion system F family protein [Mameliella sediminis]MBY6116600.1 type II secretion system F family protein [Antarctobacter heliothermus]MBY6146353.1 type II secretion system F family protein [Mameliella alba]MBV7396693.1 type II secretion system F family protein [Mameliella sediminis]MBY6162983.1 type II secretion system F family protein [Mameliella alba]MBY6171247.1 type II secretion system F family protein [Mameliella alba]
MLDTLNTMITDMLGPAGPLIVVAGLAGLLILATIPMLLNAKPDPLDKLKQDGQKRMNAETRAVLRERSKNEKLNKYAQFLEPQDEKEYSEIRTKMMQAGYRSKDAVQMYYFAQFALGVTLLGAGVAYYLLMIDPATATMQTKLMYILGPGVFGYMAPKYWINKRVAKRQEQIQQGFPDSLDMMLVCVEAGQSMEQSIVRVAKELRSSFPPLAEEYQIISYEMKAGKDKSQVLNDMADRCGLPDISSFVTVLNQAQTFGTSISDALRVYAGEMRDKRVMRAEEAANKLPTKMTLTTMMLTVPPLLIILVGPSAVGISEMGSIAVGN